MPRKHRPKLKEFTRECKVCGKPYKTIYRHSRVCEKCDKSNNWKKKKMKEIIIPLMILFLLIPTVLANSDLEISLTPHYYKNGVEVIPTTNMEFTDISFEVIGKNYNERYRILNLSITDSFPIAFKNSLPNIEIDMLRILQTKTLFISQLIDINEFNQTNISLWIGVEGMSEEIKKIIYTEGNYNLELPEQPIKKQGVFYKLGNKIWEDNSTGGILIVLVAIFGVGFAYWKYKFSDKLEKYRTKSERRRINRRRDEEGY